MTLTPSTVRQDLKCGKGAISKGEKCTKGPATKASLAENILKYGGVAGAVGSVAYAIHPKSNAFAALAGMHASLGAVASGVAMEGSRTKNRAKQLMATSIAASNLGAAAFHGYAAKSLGDFNRSYRRTAETINRGQRESNENFNRTWESVGGSRQTAPGASGGQRNRSVGSNKAVANPFKDLGVSEGASDADIKKKWLQLMRENHPDVGGDPRKAQQFNAAYQEIMRRRGKLDSIYADGFNIDMEALSL